MARQGQGSGHGGLLSCPDSGASLEALPESEPMLNRISITVVLIVTLLLSWLLGGWSGYRQLEQDSLQEAFRYRQLVANELNRYLPVPALIAEHPLLADALKEPDNAVTLLRANEQMQRMATIVGGSDIYLMDLTGMTIAANNFGQPDTFVGNNYAFRPYFSEAVATGESVAYFALGKISSERGLYFTNPVRDQRGNMLGVVAIKVLVHELESQWHRPETRQHAEMVVLDGDGISFLSSRTDWLYRDFRPTDNAEENARVRQRYPERELKPVDFVEQGKPWGLADESARIRLRESDKVGTYLTVETGLPRLDWSLLVLTDTRPILWTRIGFMAGGLALFLACFLTWLYLRERYRRERELALRGEQLERRVAQRTADLRETQQELIQAAKLAVLGQMSAGLNHEINQPLTAIQAYARNSRKFLERGATDMVDANLGEIVALCDKMADLIRVEQVMANLLANAVQAVEGCKQPQIDILVAGEGNDWRCVVKDNGHGLPGNSEQVFEPFFTTRSVKQGLGLGLSISRQIVEALGGSLTGQNRVDGPGAEFVLTLKQRKAEG